MSFAVASLRCEHAIEINGVDNVKTSFPNFVEYINNNANQPNERNMVKGLKGDWEGKLTTKELYTLFHVKTSFPNFVELANSIGMNIVEI
jgi:5-enolpyruvylshikimate-3-phosphate synthase